MNLAKIPGIPPDFITARHRQAALEEADKALLYLERIGAESVFFTDISYPRRLRQCPDAPLLLYAKGAIDWNPEKVISIVGTRHATDYGKQLVHELIGGISGHKPLIISGMAYGIDICAHSAAIQHQLPTIGVLGHGLHCLYPAEHEKTAKAMLSNGGLISEFPPGTGPEPMHFPMRNRIVAGMSDATLVIESGEKGGSLITAALANDYNRDVFAFPGDVQRSFSRGCLQLIREQKANLLTGSADFLAYMGWDKEPEVSKVAIQSSLFTELSPVEEKIVAALSKQPEMAVDSIGYHSSLTPGEVSSHLLSLEFKGLVRSLPGRRYSLTIAV